MGIRFYTSVVKGLKLKVRKVSGLSPTFVEITGEKLLEGTLLPPTPLPPSQSRIKLKKLQHKFFPVTFAKFFRKAF